MRKKLLLSAITFVALVLAAGCGESKNSEHADHSGHSEAQHAQETHETHESHAGEEAGAHEGEEAGAHEGESVDAHAGEAPGAHEGEGEISVTAAAIKMAEITLAQVSMGKINASIDFSGEVGFNEDRLVHITPRFPGIVKQANYKIGEFVRADDVVAVIESNESMTQYSLKAPIGGRIIEKHAASGEHVSGTESLYLLADLSTVWVNLAVYPKDATKIKVGDKVTITAVGAESITEGTIDYVTPVMDAQTRRITARVVLANANNTWRPGTFVNAHREMGDGEEGLVVEKKAIQILDGKSVVFIQHEPNTFKPVEVRTGSSDSRRIRILDGLAAGDTYVNNGAFELKAKIVTSSLGAHAGHGH